MSGNGSTVREYYKCIHVDRNLLGAAFKELAHLTGGSIAAAVQLAQSLRLRPYGYRSEDDPVSAFEYDGGFDSLFEGLQLTAYSVEDGMFLFRVRQAYPPKDPAQAYEVRLAEALSAPRALQSIAVDLPVQSVGEDESQFRCDLAPLVETLGGCGFRPARPHAISAMTGQVAVAEVGSHLLQPMEPSRTTAPVDRWRERVGSWVPTWSFANSLHLYVSARLTGCVPARLSEKQVGPDSSRARYGVELPYQVDGSVLFGSCATNKVGGYKVATLSVAIRRHNVYPNHPHPLLMVDDGMQAEARKLAATLAAIDMR